MRELQYQNRSDGQFLGILITTIYILLSSTSSFASSTTAFQWVASKNNPDGSYALADDIATPFQATSEVLQAFKLQNQSAQINSAAALDFINAETPHSTETLSRKIIANFEVGSGVSILLDELKAVAWADGGFGEFAGFQPTALDTAFALNALQAAGSGGSEVALRALSYLISLQTANGGWSDGGNNAVTVYTTALAARALIPYINQYSQAATAVTAAGRFLLSQQDGTGLWASDFESALALLALAQSVPGRSSIAASVSAFNARQQADGSWNGDVYITALALQLLAVLENPVANPGFSALQGRVIDGGTGNALSGVTVSIEGSTVNQTLSDFDGNFKFTSIPPGQYAITVNLSGYGALHTTTDLAASRLTDLGTLSLLTLTGNPQTATIMGTVTDADSGQALSGVSIASDMQSTLTAANGGYQLNKVPPGTVTVNADAPGYIGASAQTQLDAGDVFIFSPRLMPGQSDTSDTYLYGAIKDADTGLPLVGVVVNINGVPVGATDTAGTYRIEPLIEGLIGVTVSFAGYDTVDATLKILPNSRYKFSPLLYRSGATPFGVNTAGISGIVMDAASNQPLSGVSFKAHHDNGVEIFTTGSAGEFAVTGITDAEVILEFTHTGYQSVALTFPIQPLESVDIGQIRLRSNAVRSLLPDLTVISLTKQNLSTKPQSLKMNGTLQATIKNQGTVASSSPVQILAYYDGDNNNTFNSVIDTVLGTAQLTAPMSVDSSETVDITIDGTMAFRDAPVKIWVDSLRNVAESDEDNNQISTSSSCHGQPLPIGTLEPVLKWHWSGSSYQPSYNQVMSTPVVAQLNDDNGDTKINNDDIPDIVFNNYYDLRYGNIGLLRAVSGKDGKEIWQMPSTPRWVTPLAGPAVGDIDNDGLVEIVIGGTNNSGLIAYENDGRLKWSVSASGAGYVQPALADLDHDGKVEIIYGANVFNANGSIRWKASRSDLIPIVADLDSDGYLDVFIGGNAYNHNGEIKWSYGLGGFGGAIGNFDGDSYPEIVYQSGNSTVTLLEHNGIKKWGPVAVPGGGGGPLTVADFDGDGEPEIGMAGASNYVVFETDGSIKWQSSTQDFSSKVTGSSLFDFEGDGKVEVVYGDEVKFRIYDGATGKVLFEIPNSSRTTLENPIIADIDNDNHAEIIVVANNDVFPGINGVRVFENRNDNWMPTRSIWNQHAYHIDNVNDDGTIPQHESSSWLSHNTYRLNTFPDRNALDQTDLTLGRLLLIDNGFSQKPSLSIRIGNAGLAALDHNITVAFYQGAPGAGGVLLGKLTLDALAIGDYKDISLANVTLAGGNDLYAVADADLRVTECDEANNQVSIPVTSAVALGKIETALDAAEYGPHSPAQLSAVIENTGALQASYSAQLRIEDAEGNPVTAFAPVAIADLAGGASTSLQQDWNTELFLSGGYRLHGLLFDSGGNLMHEHSVPFTIVNEQIPVLNATIFTDKPIYASFDQVQLTGRLINTSQNTLMPATMVDITIYAPDERVLFTNSVSQGELTPAALRDVSFTYNLIDALSGNYRVELRFKDAASEQLIANRSTSFAVERQLVQALNGTVAAAPVSLYQGDPMYCTETVSYLSSTSANSVNLTSQLLNMDTGEVIKESTRTIGMSNSQPLTDVRSIDTDILKDGAYACILIGEIDGISRRLDFAGFDVKAPPIHIDSQLRAGKHGRILVLLDAGNSNVSHGSNQNPSPEMQRAYLEKLLYDAGWSYTIVTDVAGFAKQLHTGGYAVYMLLSAQVKLGEYLQKELREAVYRGEGLIEAGSHDQRQDLIDDILGIKFLGKQPAMSGITVSNSNAHNPGSAVFRLTDNNALKADNLDADILGSFTNTDEPAMTTRQYGAGRADYFGFDLLAEASIPGADPFYGELLMDALEHVHPDAIVPLAGGVYPLQLLLSNEGIATTGQIVITLPAGVDMIDNGAAIMTDKTLIWPFDLLPAQTLAFDSWLSLPITPIQITAFIQSGVSPDFKDHTTATLEIIPLQTPALAEILIDVQALDPNVYKHVFKYLQWAIRDQQSGNISNALTSLIRASDALIDIGSGADAAVRKNIAEAIRILAQKL